MKKKKVNMQNIINRINRAMHQARQGAYNKRINIWRTIGEIEGYKVAKFIIDCEMGNI